MKFTQIFNFSQNSWEGGGMCCSHWALRDKPPLVPCCCFFASFSQMRYCSCTVNCSTVTLCTESSVCSCYYWNIQYVEKCLNIVIGYPFCIINQLIVRGAVFLIKYNLSFEWRRNSIRPVWASFIILHFPIRKAQTRWIKGKVTLEQDMKTQRGSNGIAVLFNIGDIWGWVVNASPRLLYPLERDPLPIVH
jgi:hypothetical protein